MTSRELIFLKPDAIENKLVGKIIARLEEASFAIVRMKKGRISADIAMELYPDSETQLVGMGNKTLKAMTDKGQTELIPKLFGTTDPKGIGIELNKWNRAFATSAEVVAMVLEKKDAADAPTMVRTLVGATDPARADKGTIRGDFSKDAIYQANLEKRAVKNLIHASDADRAEIEIKLFEDKFFK